jgi:hypothetical protein
MQRTFPFWRWYSALAPTKSPDQQRVQDEVTAASSDQRALQEARRQRTLGESESGRIYNQGPLR